jgi:hypothetical protein
LKSQLSEQGKKVDVISSSNIVTGKNPVKVELTNPNPKTNGTLAYPEEKVSLSWQEELRIHDDAPYAIKIILTSNESVDPVRLAVVCDHELKYSEFGFTPQPFAGNVEIYDKDKKMFVVIANAVEKVAMLRPDAPMVFHLSSDKPFKILRMERIPL